MTRDLRRFAHQTNARLIIGGILILFLIGDGLIYIIYGREAAILGFACLILGLAPLALIGFSLWILDWIVSKVHQ